MRPASLRTVYPGPGGFDPQEIKREFPIFASNPGLVFLDSGASAQKPRSVIDRISNYYSTDYANVHRGVYRLSARSTELFEEAREKMRAFLNAADSREIVFVRGATEGINLVAQSWGATFLKPGDEVLISELEHHSNIVPWQILRDRIGIRLVVAPIDATGGLDFAAFEALLSPRTRLVYDRARGAAARQRVRGDPGQVDGNHRRQQRRLRPRRHGDEALRRGGGHRRDQALAAPRRDRRDRPHDVSAPCARGRAAYLQGDGERRLADVDGGRCPGRVGEPAHRGDTTYEHRISDHGRARRRGSARPGSPCKS